MRDEKFEDGGCGEMQAMGNAPKMLAKLPRERQVVDYKRRKELMELACSAALTIEKDVKVHERGIFFAMLESLLSGEVR